MHWTVELHQQVNIQIFLIHNILQLTFSNIIVKNSWCGGKKMVTKTGNVVCSLLQGKEMGKKVSKESYQRRMPLFLCVAPLRLVNSKCIGVQSNNKKHWYKKSFFHIRASKVWEKPDTHPPSSFSRLKNFLTRLSASIWKHTQHNLEQTHTLRLTNQFHNKSIEKRREEEEEYGKITLYNRFEWHISERKIDNFENKTRRGAVWALMRLHTFKKEAVTSHKCSIICT